MFSNGRTWTESVRGHRSEEYTKREIGRMMFSARKLKKLLQFIR
jgi:hypothetical protein